MLPPPPLNHYTNIMEFYGIRRQLGIVNFGPLKTYFLEVHTGATVTLPSIPGEPPLSVTLDRGWSAEGGSAPPSQPALVRSSEC